jgi:hypothetical protein
MGRMQPMLATRGDHVPVGPEWTHEVKWDGIRGSGNEGFVPAPKKYSVEPIDLMPEQSERLIRAIAVYDAKCAALDAGMSVAEVDAQTWVVEIHPSEDRTSK